MFVYYTYTNQTQLLVDAMAGEFTARGCDVERAPIEFTDKRFAERFSRFPMRHALLEVGAMLLPVIRGTRGEIRFANQEILKGEYDLVVVGSPTWWLSTSIPVHSFLESDAAKALLKGKRFAAFVTCRRYWNHNLNTVKKVGTKQGGTFVDGIHFTYLGGQIRSLLSLVSYLGTGEYQERFLGVKIPPTNLQPYQLDEARVFAGGLADRVPIA